MNQHRLTGKEAQRINLGKLLQNSVEFYGDRPFVIQAETGEKLSYCEFNQLTNKIARGLQDMGVGHRDYVGIMLPNSFQYLASAYALKKLGAVEVSINNTFKGVALTRMINLTVCKILITTGQFLHTLDTVMNDLLHLECLLVVDEVERAKKLFADKSIKPFIEFEAQSDINFSCDFADDETAAILFTSGTTGVSKGCTIPHRCSVRAAESMIEAFALTQEDCVYTPYPLFHAGAVQYDILPAMMVGGRAIIRAGFSLTHFWSDVSKYGATWFMALGSVQQLLWANPSCEEETQHSLRFFWGTPLPVDHRAFEARFNLKVVRGGGYGSTDAGSVALPLFDNPGAGKILDRYEVAIVAKHDDVLPIGEVGELVLRPREPAIMSSEYIGMPEVTLESWRNLWFHTGDLARLDDFGNLYWLARMSERIRVKGEMVSAYEIEEVILQHGAVADCAVIGISDGRGEEEVKACVSLRENSDLTLLELVEFCNAKMSRFMLPAHLQIMENMPRTPTGKIAKAELK